MLGMELLAKGGIVMAILAGLSVYVVAVVLFKVWQFMTSSATNMQFVDKVMVYVKHGELAEGGRMLGAVKGPVAKVMRVAIACVMNRKMSRKSREQEVARVGSAELRYLESHMRGLEMVATTAPLLGLLGTVMGMVAAFSTIGTAGTRIDPSMLADGIWEALLTTVAGLIVAIPALASHYVIDSQIEKVRAAMKDVTVQILSVDDQYQAANAVEMNGDFVISNVQQEELLAREEALRVAIEEQEKAIASLKSAQQMQGSGQETLKLLNPSYVYRATR